MLRRRDFLAGTLALLGKPALAADSELRAAAREAWLYALPLIEIAGVRARSFARGGKPGQFQARRNLATPKDRDVTTPNSDTIYAPAFVDLANGPAKLALPAAGKRYVSLALMDMWSDNFAVLGTRTTGPDGGEFTLVGPDQAAGPGAIRSPTPWVWALARVLVDGPDDIEAARRIQDGFTVKAQPARSDPLPSQRDAAWPDYFATAQLMLLDNPPPATDTAILRRIAPLGLKPGGGFDSSRFAPNDVAEIEAGVAEARRIVQDPTLGVSIVDGWSYQRPDTGDFGQDYFYRARIALSGLAALPIAEAMYLSAFAPEGGIQFDGARNWRLGFRAGGLPPVDAFWSLTLYSVTSAGQLFLSDNAIARYAIGDRTPGLNPNPDGSLDIWISRADPGGERSSNWLPAPASGPFALILRAYLPGAAMTAGAYRPPPVVEG